MSYREVAGNYRRVLPLWPNHQAIEGQRYIIGQFFLYVRLQTHLVADVREISMTRADRVYHFERLAEIEVGDVLLALQSV